MTDDRWIVVPNWDGPDGFQHYGKRDPVWIKNYRSLLAKEEYLTLTFNRRGILHGLWLEYASSNRRLRDNTLTLTRRLGQRVVRADLEALNHAGWIGFSASTPFADHAMPEAEAEAEDISQRQRQRAGEAEPVPFMPVEKELEVDKILCGLKDVTVESRPVLLRLAMLLPPAGVAKVRESVQAHPGVGVGWAVNALKSEIAERAAA